MRSDRTRTKTRGAGAAALAALLLLGVAACGGGGGAREADAGDPGYLDPPSLADVEIGEIGPGVPVLCYHYFRGRVAPGYALRVMGSVLLGMPALGPREFWTTPVGEFEKHLRFLRDNDITVLTLDEVADHVAGKRPLPRRAVVLTIDDADISVYRHAFPLLQEYGVRAHLFVPTAHVGSKWSGLRVCDWEQLNEMAASGAVVLGSHTNDLHYKVQTARGWEPVFWHPDRMTPERRSAALSQLARGRRENRDWRLPAAAEELLEGPWAAVAADLMASRQALELHTGRAPDWLAWPYGFARAGADSISRLAGFRGTVTLSPYVFSQQDSLLSVGRFTLTAKTTLEQVSATMPPR